MPLDFAALVTAFNEEYSTENEAKSNSVREQFLQRFPMGSLTTLDLDQYVVGMVAKDGFCNWVESRTRDWANIQGATSSKFGVYFGTLGKDMEPKYRFVKRWGTTLPEAWENIRHSLLELTQLGAAPVHLLDFAAIDANPLTQMFKAKILSLYFPDKFVNVCSSENISGFAQVMGLTGLKSTAQMQHLLLTVKKENSLTAAWSNPKFMSFLYWAFGPALGKPPVAVEPPKTRQPRRIDFEMIEAARRIIGGKAEEFAWNWEVERLQRDGKSALVPEMQNRTDRPGYGYDFLSHTRLGEERYIEVKAVGRVPNSEDFRFFLSDNEYQTSRSKEKASAYYFYLVVFGQTGPEYLLPILASEVYQLETLKPAAYVVNLGLRRGSASSVVDDESDQNDEDSEVASPRHDAVQRDHY
ncbi:DUF3883 domain-containing protein [Silvimonas sp. JCM 19000]